MIKKVWKKIILGIAGVLLTIGGAGAGYKIIKKYDSAELDKNPQLVTEAIDGDTIAIEPEGERIKIRLLGIDSPEKGECYFEESKNFAKNLLEDSYIKLVKDVSEKDDYGRLLRYVILQNEDSEKDNIIVNEYLLQWGYAEILPSSKDKLYRQLFNIAQGEAKAEKRGIWAECKDPDDTTKFHQTDTNPENPECNIKGNISEKGYGKIYLVPGCDNYNTVKIDPRKGEKYFCTEQEAEQAGFRKTTNCP